MYNTRLDGLTEYPFQRLAALVAGGLGVTQFREVQTDLEEAFMTVAQSDDEELAEATEQIFAVTSLPDVKCASTSCRNTAASTSG